MSAKIISIANDKHSSGANTQTMTNTMPMPLALSPVGSLESYITRVNQIPMLSQEEERQLAEDFQQHQDLDAARRLVMSHLRFVVKVARGYSGYGLDQSDLIQEGNIGLMKAVKRFDPNVGVRLVSFAVHWVRAEMHEFILKNWRIVKVATTKAQRKLFFNLRSSKKRLGWLNQQEVDEVAQELGVSSKDVMEMEMRMNANDQAFDLNPAEDDDGKTYGPSLYLEADSATPEQQLEHKQLESRQNQALASAITSLDERSQDIIQRRWLNEKKATLTELAEQYGISAERVRQVEQMAFKKLKTRVEQST